jgi:hypothetical protein
MTRSRRSRSTSSGAPAGSRFAADHAQLAAWRQGVLLMRSPQPAVLARHHGRHPRAHRSRHGTNRGSPGGQPVSLDSAAGDVSCRSGCRGIPAGWRLRARRLRRPGLYSTRGGGVLQPDRPRPVRGAGLTTVREAAMPICEHPATVTAVSARVDGAHDRHLTESRRVHLRARRHLRGVRSDGGPAGGRSVGHAAVVERRATRSSPCDEDRCSCPAATCRRLERATLAPSRPVRAGQW